MNNTKGVHYFQLKQFKNNLNFFKGQCILGSKYYPSLRTVLINDIRNRTKGVLLTETLF